MKIIDIKSAIIGFLLCAVLFLSMGLANNATIDVRIVEVDKKIGEAIELGGSAVRLRALEDEHLVRVWAGP